MDFATLAIIVFLLLTVIIICLIGSLLFSTNQASSRSRRRNISYPISPTPQQRSSKSEDFSRTFPRDVERILSQLRPNPNEVGRYDIRSYSDWNIAQDTIEGGKLWAILDIHEFGHERQHWEVWVNGKKYATRYSLTDANEAMTEAERRYGRR